MHGRLYISGRRGLRCSGCIVHVPALGPDVSDCHLLHPLPDCHLLHPLTKDELVPKRRAARPDRGVKKIDTADTNVGQKAEQTNVSGNPTPLASIKQEPKKVL